MGENLNRKNSRLVLKLVLVVVGMFGFGYALVPLYDVLCDITGINGKAGKVSAPETSYKIDLGREVKIEFLTSLNENTPLAFSAEISELKIHPGEYRTVKFFAKNKTDHELLARAIPSFSPGGAAEYFNKVQCFCFEEQTFKPGEAKQMPMRFVIKPDIPEQYKTITLSYTFFDNTKAAVKN